MRRKKEINEYRTFNGEKYQLLLKRAVSKVYLKEMQRFMKSLKVRMRSIKKADDYYIYLNYKDLS